MYGLTLGEQTYGAESLYWRAFVESGVNVAQDGDALGIGNPIAQGIAASAPDGALTLAPVAIGTSSPNLDAQDAESLSSVSVIEAGTNVTADGDVSPSTVVVIEARSAIAQDGDLTPAPVAIGTSGTNLSADGDLAPVVAAIATGGTAMMTAQAVMSLSASAGEAVPILDEQPPELLPLAMSHEADALEAELKALFMEMFEKYIRPEERWVNVLGMPQHGPRELIEASLANDGLSIYRGAEVASGAGAYLLRAWRAHNPKRGTHLLRTYLQLLWPNVWKANQMWQDKSKLYPTALTTTDGGNHFLTSRIHVALPARVTSGGDLNAIQSGLRAALPARMVLQVAIESEDSFGIGLANVFVPGLVAQSYEGTIS